MISQTNPKTSVIVSIGMPVFNDKPFIERAILSVLNQTYENWELLLSDDASSDGSSEICLKYSNSDPRIKYRRHDQNLGISKNMSFLLEESKGFYFMWAANDDIWDKDFISKLVNNLEANPSAICSFCVYSQVDEEDTIILEKEHIYEDYSGASATERLKKLIKQKSDGCGYGLFVRSEILGADFPVWWFANRICAYNNIFPFLCFALAKGNYVLYKERSLWFNRVKTEKNIHHKIPFPNNFLLLYSFFFLRKFNLVFISLISVVKAEKKIYTAIRIAPRMLYSWFFIPVFFDLIGKCRAFRRNDLNAFI